MGMGITSLCTAMEPWFDATRTEVLVSAQSHPLRPSKPRSFGGAFPFGWAWIGANRMAASENKPRNHRNEEGWLKPPPFVFSTRRRGVDSHASQAHDYINANDLVALRRLGSFTEHNVRWRNVNQFVPTLDIVMVMLRIVGIKITLRGVDCDLS